MDLSTKGAKMLNKKGKMKKRSHNTTHDLVNKSKLNDLAKSILNITRYFFFRFFP